MIKNKIRINDLKRVFKENALIGILMLLSNVIAVNIITISNYYSADDNLKNFHKKIQFIFESSDGSSALLVTIFATVFPMILAWRMFSFVNKKKNINVYFSIGVSRKDMFKNRFIVASVMMVISIVVPFLIGTIWNVSVFGSSDALFQSALFVVFRLLACSFFAFTVTVLVASLVGTKGEQFVVAPIFVFGITAVTFFADLLRRLLFYGGVIIGRGTSSEIILNDYTYLSGQNANEVLNNFNRFNNFPVIGNEKIIGKYMKFEKGAEKIPADMVAMAGLILLVAALSFFAYRAFVNRKAENAGFFGVSPFVNIFFTGTIAIGIVAVVVSTIDWQVRIGTTKKLNTIVLLGIIAGIFLLTYVVLIPILTRNKKVFVKSLWKLPVFVLVLMIPAIVLSTGGFGASKKIPEISEIKAATVSVPIDITLTGKVFSGSMHGGYINLEGTSDCNFIGFTSERDLEQIRKIHKSLIDIKDESESRKRPYMDNLIITYQLKDGTIISRKYDYFNRSVADELLKIVDSDFLKNEYIDAFSNTVSMTKKEYEKYAQNFPYKSHLLRNSNAVNSKLNGRIIEVINAQGIVTDISMDETQIVELRKAVSRDLKTVPLSKIYLDKKHNVGTIKFKEPEELGRGYDPFAPKIPIVEDMKNTLNYLEKFEFSKKQGEREKATSALVYDIKNFQQNNGSRGSGTLEYYLFTERIAFSGLEEDEHYKKNLKTGFAEFNSKDNILKLQSLSLTNQYTYNEGYVVLYKYADSTRRAEYISYEKMPDELKPV